MPTETFDTPGEYTWQVPSGVEEVEADLRGAEGGKNSGGLGGRVVGVLDVTPGELLTLNVAGENGGHGGGGEGGNTSSTGAGDGGGASDIRQGGSTLDDRKAVAGGGGGGGGGTNASGAGGDGGPDNGEDGQDAGRASGGEGGGQGGGSSTGGDGESASAGSSFQGSGGGGGGGYEGGEGGGADNLDGDGGGGGAGSNYDDGLASTSANDRGVNSGDGSVTITYTALPEEPTNVQQDVEDDETATVTGDEDASQGDPDNHEIEVNLDGSGWSSAATVTGGDFSHTEPIDRSVDTVRFRARAVNSAGSSAWVYTTEQSTNVSGLQITSVNATTIDIEWGDPDANDGTDVLLAEASGSTAPDYEVDQSLGADASTATITDLEHGERYYIRVQATFDGADGTPSPVSNEVDTIIGLPAPTLQSVTATALREITVEYALEDNSTDGDVLLEVSTDGGTSWSEVATIDDLDATEYVHDELLDGEVYTYRLTRRTHHAEAQSGTDSAQTSLPANTGVDVVDAQGDSVTFEWSVAANNGTQRVEYRTTPSGSWMADATGLSLSTTQHTTQADLADGDEFEVRTVVETEHTSTVDETAADEEVAGAGVLETHDEATETYGETKIFKQ